MWYTRAVWQDSYEPFNSFSTVLSLSHHFYGLLTFCSCTELTFSSRKIFCVTILALHGCAELCSIWGTLLITQQKSRRRRFSHCGTCTVYLGQGFAEYAAWEEEKSVLSWKPCQTIHHTLRFLTSFRDGNQNLVRINVLRIMLAFLIRYWWNELAPSMPTMTGRRLIASTGNSEQDRAEATSGRTHETSTKKMLMETRESMAFLWMVRGRVALNIVIGCISTFIAFDEIDRLKT